MVNDKINYEKQSTSSAGHSDRHGGGPVQYQLHCPIKHAQGYSGSHWTPPSSDYSLSIAPLTSQPPVPLICHVGHVQGLGS
jgi:hypothetical protein